MPRLREGLLGPAPAPHAYRSHLRLRRDSHLPPNPELCFLLSSFCIYASFFADLRCSRAPAPQPVGGAKKAEWRAAARLAGLLGHVSGGRTPPARPAGLRGRSAYRWAGGSAGQNLSAGGNHRAAPHLLLFLLLAGCRSTRLSPIWTSVLPITCTDECYINLGNNCLLCAFIRTSSSGPAVV